jgi:ribonucleoside-diphosphate reductase alpha chain
MGKLNTCNKSQGSSSIQITENARRVLEERYLKKDSRGRILEKPEDMFHRVANTVAQAELHYDPKVDIKAREAEFYEVLANFEFLPNSPTLLNAGRRLVQLSACFVLPIGDSMKSIFDTMRDSALIQKSGGGTGFSFSRIRPKKDRVRSTGGIASGPVSFMRAFDAATGVVAQGGVRRGANMGILDIWHPDILQFITAKKEPTELTNFNLAVAVTDEYMEAVKAGTDYNLINPRSKKPVGKANAKEVFDILVTSAWETGEPGIIFIDRVNQANPTPRLGKIESTNPCGEQPLLPYESCNLGSVNLARMIKTETGTPVIDYPKLAKTVRIAVRFLDNVIDVNKFPLPKIEEATKKTRKIGVGVLGFADMLMQLGIRYDSDDAISLASHVMKFINEKAIEASVELAKERGPFPAIKDSIYNVRGGLKPRNATCTTIAPTGTISMIAGCSTGIEPLYGLIYTHNILDGSKLLEVNPYFEKVSRQLGFYSENLVEQLKAGVYLKDIKGVPDDVKHLFVTAYEVAPEFHVKMQAAFQESTQNAVSKTVNLPEEATVEDVAKVYMLAYEKGLKGITIYRNGSRRGQPLSMDQMTNGVDDTLLIPRQRPESLRGQTDKVQTGCGPMYITLNYDDQDCLFEVFSILGKAGSCATAQLEAIARLTSLSLRSGVAIADISKHLRFIRCPNPYVPTDGSRQVFSCPDAVSLVLDRNIGRTARPTKVVRPTRRPQILRGTTDRMETGCGHLYVIVNYDERGRLFEVFSVLGTAGGCGTAQLSAISRLVSLALRCGVSALEIAQHLKDIRCPSPAVMSEGKGRVSSCADAISMALEKHMGISKLEAKNKGTQLYQLTGNVFGLCPVCNNILVFQEGCYMCRSCGFNRC